MLPWSNSKNLTCVKSYLLTACKCTLTTASLTRTLTLALTFPTLSRHTLFGSWQVILTGAPHHGLSDPNQAPTPAEASAAVGQRVLAAADAHPLRPYWDYLAFLLRRLPALAPEEEMERSYRDYLQVSGAVVIYIFSSLSGFVKASRDQLRQGCINCGQTCQPGPINMPHGKGWVVVNAAG